MNNTLIKKQLQSFIVHESDFLDYIFKNKIHKTHKYILYREAVIRLLIHYGLNLEWVFCRVSKTICLTLLYGDGLGFQSMYCVKELTDKQLCLCIRKFFEEIMNENNK